eukprot:2338398-Amphidinium_carterae.1
MTCALSGVVTSVNIHPSLTEGGDQLLSRSACDGYYGHHQDSEMENQTLEHYSPDIYDYIRVSYAGKCIISLSIALQ